MSAELDRIPRKVRVPWLEVAFVPAWHREAAR